MSFTMGPPEPEPVTEDEGVMDIRAVKEGTALAAWREEYERRVAEIREAHVRRAWSTTPESLREIHRLKAEGLTQEKVAELTGWHVSTIRRAWHRQPTTHDQPPGG